MVVCEEEAGQKCHGGGSLSNQTHLAEVMIFAEFQKIVSRILLNNLVFCLLLNMISFLAILD